MNCKYYKNCGKRVNYNNQIPLNEKIQKVEYKESYNIPIQVSGVVFSDKYYENKIEDNCCNECLQKIEKYY